MVNDIQKLIEAMAAGPQAMEMLSKFQTPEAAAAADPRIAMVARGSEGGEGGQRRRSPRGGGGGGALPSSQSGLPTPEMQLITMLAQGGQMGPAAAAGRAYAASADGSIAGNNRHRSLMDRAFAGADPNNSMDWSGRSARRNVVRTQPSASVGFGAGIKGHDSSRNYEEMDRMRDRRWAAQDERDGNARLRRRIALLQQMMGGGGLTETETVDDEQYVNNAGRWDKKPTRRVTTRNGGMADIIRLLGA